MWLYLQIEDGLAEANQACNQNQVKNKQDGVLKPRHSNPGNHAHTMPVQGDRRERIR